MVTINIGVVGAGTVGGGVVKIFNKQGLFFNTKIGLSVHLKRIVDINTSLFEQLPIGDALCTDNVDDIINDPDIQIVVELIGGISIARTFVLRALKAGKHVVTANKALVAEYGPEIFQTAEACGVSVYFEGSVGGGMPTIKTMRESVIGNEIFSVETIINGTCNFILTQMTQHGYTFDAALKSAQEKGFAEADPSFDIRGIDTAHKLAIIASLLYGGYVPYRKIYCEGITHITAEDIAFAQSLGYCVKLLGIVKKKENEPIVDIRIHPAMLHNNHILASVANEVNAVYLQGDAVGPLLLYGKGAGQMPTASAVVGDIIDVARNITHNSGRRIYMDFYSPDREISVLPISKVCTRYYMRFSVVEKPKVLAAITSVLGDHGISIASVIQKEIATDDCVPVIMLTHKAREDAIQKAIVQIERNDIIKNKTQIIRIEE